MKKFFLALVIGLCCVAGGVDAANESVVFVDLQEVFKRFYKGQLAKDQVRQQESDIKLERETMEDEIALIKDEIGVLRADSRDETLSDEVRAGKRDLLEEKLVELQKRTQEIVDYETLRKEQLKQQNTRMSKKLFDEIHEAISELALEKGYVGVIDRSAQNRFGMQIVLYVELKSDITAEVLAVLNEGHDEEDESGKIQLEMER